MITVVQSYEKYNSVKARETRSTISTRLHYTTRSYHEEPAGGSSCAFQESCKVVGFELVRKEYLFFGSGKLLSILLFINIHTWHSILCLTAPSTHSKLTFTPYTFRKQRLLSRELLPLKQFQPTWPAKSRHKRALWVFIRARCRQKKGGKKKIEWRSTANCGTQQEVLTPHTHNSNPEQVGPRRTRHGQPCQKKEKYNNLSDWDDSLPVGVFCKRQVSLETNSYSAQWR